MAHLIASVEAFASRPAFAVVVLVLLFAVRFAISLLRPRAR